LFTLVAALEAALALDKKLLFCSALAVLLAECQQAVAEIGAAPHAVKRAGAPCFTAVARHGGWLAPP
jgi:hypothetical protein